MDRHFTSPWMLGMYKIVIVHPRPRMVLAENVPVTPEFRAYCNQWNIEMFGYVYDIEPGKMIKDEENKILYIRADEWPGLAAKHSQRS